MYAILIKMYSLTTSSQISVRQDTHWNKTFSIFFLQISTNYTTARARSVHSGILSSSVVQSPDKNIQNESRMKSTQSWGSPHYTNAWIMESLLITYSHHAATISHLLNDPLAIIRLSSLSLSPLFLVTQVTSTPGPIVHAGLPRTRAPGCSISNSCWTRGAASIARCLRISIGN